ncbi:MAG: cofactor-independent phosphoglycerate mutase [Chloroflexota bacterium]|nr:cofactor-independent phosphoglycerate mutase [Chloroflexota bacterium]
MKYCVLIIDGAAGWPLDERGKKTTLELASTPNLDRMARDGVVGLVRTVPPGMEPSSAVACMSVLGYDPAVYYGGRSAIEAISMDIPFDENDVLFRCNLVSIRDGAMRSYCAGHITSDEGRALIEEIDAKLGGDGVRFYPGVGYRHICKLTGRGDALSSVCTPPHDIPDKPIAEYMPHSDGSDVLVDLMERSKGVLQNHRINMEREARGGMPANMIWLFWGSGRIPELPSFRDKYGLSGAMISAVDLLRGLAKMSGLDVLEIDGVTDNIDNDYAGQIAGALDAFTDNDIVVVHVEAPDEAGHGGSIDNKVRAIEDIDREMVSRLHSFDGGDLRVLVMPDHPTPIAIKTHTTEPVPFLLWGSGIDGGDAKRFSEAEAADTGLFIDKGYTVLDRLVRVRC